MVPRRYQISCQCGSAARTLFPRAPAKRLDGLHVGWSSPEASRQRVSVVHLTRRFSDRLYNQPRSRNLANGAKWRGGAKTLRDRWQQNPRPTAMDIGWTTTRLSDD